jgi:hypothetical protein
MLQGIMIVGLASFCAIIYYFFCNRRAIRANFFRKKLSHLEMKAAETIVYAAVTRINRQILYPEEFESPEAIKEIPLCYRIRLVRNLISGLPHNELLFEATEKSIDELNHECIEEDDFSFTKLMRLQGVIAHSILEAGRVVEDEES